MVFRRIVSLDIDAILSVVLLLILLFVLKFFPKLAIHPINIPDDTNLQIILGAIGHLLYCLVGFVSTAVFGKSPGQKIAGFSIVNKEGKKISLLQSIALYASFMWVSILLTLGIGCLMILFRNDRRGLHNLMTQTYVRSDL